MTSQEHAVERLRAAWASAADRAVPTGDCPSAEELWDAVRGDLPPGPTRQIGLHVVACPACAEAWGLARDIAAGSVAASGIPPRAEPIVPRARAWLGRGSLATAAAALIIVVVAFLLFRGSPEEATSPGFRTPLEEPIQSLLPAGDPLSRERCVLRWAGPDGARYEIRVATADLDVLAEAGRLAAAEYEVPAEALDALPAGAKLLWQVKATLPDGRRLTSRTFVSTLE